MSKDSSQTRVIFSYSLTHLAIKDKVRFYYALKGRGGNPGIIKQYDVEQINRGVLSVKDAFVQDVTAFLDLWKCKYTSKEISLVPVEGKKQFHIFSYSIKHLQFKDKVRFYYALKGRDGKSGIVKALSIEQLAKGVLFVGKANKQVEEFLQFWKCEYTHKEVFT